MNYLNSDKYKVGDVIVFIGDEHLFGSLHKKKFKITDINQNILNLSSLYDFKIEGIADLSREDHLYQKFNKNCPEYFKRL